MCVQTLRYSLCSLQMKGESFGEPVSPVWAFTKHKGQALSCHGWKLLGVHLC